MRMTKKALSIVLAAMMIMSMLVVGTVGASAAGTVAKIGDNEFETLTAALNAANDGDTVTVVADCEGDGWVAPQDKFNNQGLTVDFGGFTYTVSGKPVGSSGTETIAFQLLKGNKITFTNGTIYGDTSVNPRDGRYLLRMIQNYSDLTLDGMTVSMKGYYTGLTTMSNCNGTTTINNSTINAADYTQYGYNDPSELGSYAISVGTFQGYNSVTTTVTGTSVINGDITVDPSGDHAADFELNLEGGTINGGVILNDAAEAAVAADPDKFTTDDSFTTNVAMIGNTYYPTLLAALNAAVDGDTVTVLADCAGDGWSATQGKFNTNGLTVDFCGNTYTMDGAMVGSTGTKTQAFQLLKDNKITFQYGTITSAKALMLVQNYSDLTLKNMVLDGSNLNKYSNAYTLSNNNGNVVINNTTIIAKPGSSNYAFDVCRYASYPSVNVTVTGNSQINGNVQVDAGSGDAKDGFSLTLESGTMTGSIVTTDDAKTAIKNTPEKAEVTKTNTFDQTAPTGYVWVDNGDGTSSIQADVLTYSAVIKGYQRKYQKTSSYSAEGNDVSTRGVRIMTKVDNDFLATCEDYGYVVAKVNDTIAQDTADFTVLDATGNNGQKVISCRGSENEGLGSYNNAVVKTNYVTLAVNGMSSGDKVAVRFFVIKDGKTYYANYENVVDYDGIIAKY